jgi:hypothetical protein
MYSGPASARRAAVTCRIRGASAPLQERLSCDPAHAARAEKFREGNKQMDRQEEQIAHELKIITPANLHKTAP